MIVIARKSNHTKKKVEYEIYDDTGNPRQFQNVRVALRYLKGKGYTHEDISQLVFMRT